MKSRTLAERKALFAKTTLYPVVTPEFCAGRPVLSVVEAILNGGAGLLQLRLKNPVSDADFFALAKNVRRLTAAFNAVLIIDDRIDIALAVDADGVHLGQGDLPLREAKRIAPELLIGVSTHNLPEIRAAHTDNADYLNVGPIFPTATKNVSYPVVGLDNLQRFIPEISIPFSVMGGIKSHHLSTLSALGARRPAMVTEITAADDIASKVREMISLI